MRKSLPLLSLTAVFLFLNSQIAMAEVIFSENYNGITSNLHPSGTYPNNNPPTTANGAQMDWTAWAGWGETETDTYMGVTHYQGEITNRGHNGGKTLTLWRRRWDQAIQLQYTGAQATAQYTLYGGSNSITYLDLYAPSGNLQYHIYLQDYSLGSLSSYINTLPDWSATLNADVDGWAPRLEPTGPSTSSNPISCKSPVWIGFSNWVDYSGYLMFPWTQGQFDQHYRDIYTRYYVRFPSGWGVSYLNIVGGGHKMNRWVFRTAHNGGATWQFIINANGWESGSSLTTWRFLFYIPTSPTAGITYFSDKNFGQMGITGDVWNCIEVHTKLNSAPGVADGLIQVWVDGVQQSFNGVYDIYYVSRDDYGALLPAETYYDGSAHLPGIGNSGGTSEPWTFPTNGWYALDFDDFVMSTNYVGPTGTPPPPYCGDLSCNGAENCSNCPQDCGTCLPAQEKFIFHDSLPAGADILQGDPMAVSNESPYQGTNSLKITGQGSWSNCRIVNLNTDVSAINWNSAYLEFALKSSAPSGYVAVNLWGDGNMKPEQAFALSGSGQYETFRINMTDFSPTQPGFGNAITQFMIGTSWGSGNPVYLDEIRIASPGQCAHKSDSTCDGCVDMNELTTFIGRWYISNADVTLKEIIEAIGLWKRGC